MVGDITHIFWDCLKLLDFWKNVQKEIKQVLGVNFTLDTALYILGILPNNMMVRNLISLLRILRLRAKKTITASWLKPQPPRIMQWRDRVKKVEKKTGLLKDGHH